VSRKKTIEHWAVEDFEAGERLKQLFPDDVREFETIAELVGCSDADPSLVAAIEQCASAEAKCQAGEITLQQLYDVYAETIPPFDACDNFDPWAKLVSRANRIAQMTGNRMFCMLY